MGQTLTRIMVTASDKPSRFQYVKHVATHFLAFTRPWENPADVQ